MGCWDWGVKNTAMLVSKCAVFSWKLEGVCPPEDWGGIRGYDQILETLVGPLCEERAELIEWLGGEFDPEHFDLQAVNKALHRRVRKK